MNSATSVGVLVVGLGVAFTQLSGCGGDAADSTAAQGDRAQLEALARTAVRVSIATVVEAQLGTADELAGVVAPFRQAMVAAETASRVIAREVEPGAAVEIGDVLIQLDASRLSLAVDEARASLSARSVDLKEARHELARGTELRGNDAMSDRQHDALGFAVERATSARALARAGLGRAERALEDATIRAPFAGTVESVAVDVGDYLAPGSPIATVVDLTRVRIRAGVTASQADAMQQGGSAGVLASTFSGRMREGTIHSVGRIADKMTGVFPIEVWLDNGDAKLRGGMVATLRLNQRDEALTLIAPSQALARRGQGVAVFVIESQGEAHRVRARPVTLGRRSGDRVEILQGLRAGDRVVTKGHFALADGAAVQIDASSAEPMAAHEATEVTGQEG